MAVNTLSNQFRKVDVDEYDENNYQDDTIDDSGEMGPNDSEVQGLLMQYFTGRNADALKLILRNPPILTKNQTLKDKTYTLAMRVLLSFKSSEVDNAVRGLDRDMIDVLMKYIYRGFSTPSDGSSAILLVWHEKAFAVGGNGSIMRVLTDRKTV